MDVHVSQLSALWPGSACTDADEQLYARIRSSESKTNQSQAVSKAVRQQVCLTFPLQNTCAVTTLVFSDQKSDFRQSNSTIYSKYCTFYSKSVGVRVLKLVPNTIGQTEFQTKYDQKYLMSNSENRDGRKPSSSVALSISCCCTDYRRV